jgi:GNAT superfamily N-acetyltransferase
LIVARSCDIPVIMPMPSRRELVVDRHALVIRRAEMGEVIDLRHRVLRAGLPRETAVFTGDDLPTTRHFGVFHNAKTICCATFHANQWQGAPAWQLRGMATDDSFRSKGVGRELLLFAEASLREEGPTRQLWANARVPAVRFYQSLGWEIVSAVFDIPTAGPHYKMSKKF